MKITRAVLVLVTLMLLISCSVPQVSVTTSDATKKPSLDVDGGNNTDAPDGGTLKPSTDNANESDLIKPTTEPVVKKSTSTLESVMAATVQLGVLDAEWNQVGTCTGSIIDPRGLIITNFHCIGDNETGTFYNADGIDYVYMTLDPRDPPKAVRDAPTKPSSMMHQTLQVFRVVPSSMKTLSRLRSHMLVVRMQKRAGNSVWHAQLPSLMT